MGREIELKIPLSRAEYNFIKDVIYSKLKLEGLVILEKPECLLKEDEYYSRYNSYEERVKNNEAQCIRLRSEKYFSEDDKLINTQSYFTIKRKTYKDGMEINQENESFISNPEVLREMFQEASYNCWFKKIKHSYSVHCHSILYNNIPIHAELVKVNDLLYFEIEVTDEKLEDNLIQLALIHLVKLFKLDPEKKDIRSWKQILRENP